MARIGGVVAGVVAAVLLYPFQAASVIDGDAEEWVKTTAGWAYHVPWNSQGFSLGLPILGGLVAGFATWAAVTLVRHPSPQQRSRAIAALVLSLAAVACVALAFAVQPPSTYRHVF